MGMMFRPRRPLMRVAAGAATATVAYKAGQRRTQQNQYNDQAQPASAQTQAESFIAAGHAEAERQISALNAEVSKLTKRRDAIVAQLGALRDVAAGFADVAAVSEPAVETPAAAFEPPAPEVEVADELLLLDDATQDDGAGEAPTKAARKA